MGNHKVFPGASSFTPQRGFPRWLGFVTVFPRSTQGVLLPIAFLLLALGTGCGGGRADFIGSRGGGRVRCGVAGVQQGGPLHPRRGEPYTEGGCPGRGQFIVQLQEASHAGRVRFFLQDVVAAGEETVVTFNEEGCRARTRESD